MRSLSYILLIVVTLVTPVVASGWEAAADKKTFKDLNLNGKFIDKLKKETIDCGDYKGYTLDALKVVITIDEKQNITARLDAIISKPNDPNKIVTMSEAIFESATVTSHKVWSSNNDYLESFEIEVGTLNSGNWFSRFFDKGDKITATVDGNHLEKRFKVLVKGANGEKMYEPVYLDTGDGC